MALGKTPGIIKLSRPYIGGFESDLLCDSFARQTVIFNTPDAKDIQIGRWENNERMITFNNITLGKMNVHTKKQYIEQDGAFVFVEKYCISGTISIVIDTRWHISKDSGITIESNLETHGILSKMLRPVVKKGLERGLKRIIHRSGDPDFVDEVMPEF